MARETIRMRRDTTRYDIRCTIRIRYGYGATRYDTLVRDNKHCDALVAQSDNDGSLLPDRVREPIRFYSIY